MNADKYLNSILQGEVLNLKILENLAKKVIS